MGDKAAKAAQLCLGDAEIDSVPAEATRLAAASLRFVDEATGDSRAREMLPLDDAFVSFITVGCPK